MPQGKRLLRIGPLKSMNEDSEILTERELKKERMLNNPRTRRILSIAIVVAVLMVPLVTVIFDNGIHQCFTLIEGTSRLLFAGIGVIVGTIIGCGAYRLFSLRPTRAATLIVGFVIGLFLGILMGASVEYMNFRLANKDNTYQRLVTIETHEIKKEQSDDRKKDDVSYKVAVKTVDDGRVFLQSGSLKQPYFDKLQLHGTYNATMVDGFFGYPVIIDFGPRVK